MLSAPLSHGDHARAILLLGLPLMGSHVAQFAITLVDTLMLGWYGVEDLAGQVLGGTLFFVLFIMASGFAWAVMPLIAEKVGDGDQTQVRRVTRMGLWLSMIAAVLSMPFFLLAGPMFRLLGQAEIPTALAAEYLRVQGWAIFPALVVMVLKSYLAALERTQVVLWVTVAAVAVNALVNWLLIFGNLGFPEMGIMGAAIASVAVNLLSAVALVVYALRVLPEHTLFQRLWRPDWEAFLRVFALGWPIGLTNLAEVGLFSASSVMMGWLGTVPLAAHGIAIQVTSMMFMVHLGLSSAATIRAGHAFGRRDGQGLRLGAGVAIALSMGIALATMAIYFAFPRALVGLFIDPADPARAEVLAIGGALMITAALFQLVDAGQVMALGLLRGLQDTRVPMLIAGFSYWVVGIGASYLLAFPLGFGGVGLWIGLALGLGTAAVLLMWRFWTRGVARVPQAPANGSSGYPTPVR